MDLVKVYYSKNQLNPPPGLDEDKYAVVMELMIENKLELVLADMALDKSLGFFPPVLYTSTPLPMNLIISPRDVIQTILAKVIDPIKPGELNVFETNLDSAFDVSTIVEEIGGYSTYPAMIYRYSDFRWQLETIAHEWVHIYLATKPLGMNYTTQSLRTLNETVAAIAGEEIGAAAYVSYFPKLENNASQGSEKPAPDLTAFDFPLFMFKTRNHVDELLLEGQIDFAEKFMEDQQKILNKIGYPIRKLNQAYFAFHGTYSDSPLGAAGSDPIGEAVRKFRASSPDLKTFLDTISQISTDKELQLFILSQ